MARNSLGKNFVVTSFGESHGSHIGVVIDGCPSGFLLDAEWIQELLDLRKPGQSSITSTRKESDVFEIISGIFEGFTTGAPICILIQNNNAIPKDYESIKSIYRPSHADYTYEKKYGIRDYKGGGRSSARVTAGWVAAGAIAMQILREKHGIQITAYVKQVHNHFTEKQYLHADRLLIAQSAVRCPDEEAEVQMLGAIQKAREEGDSLGGVVACVIENLRIGIGEPVFGKLHAMLSHAMLSINATKGFEIGSGFNSAFKKGSESNDEFVLKNDTIRTLSNNSGGVLGGISNGELVFFSVAFKPTASISVKQKTVNQQGEEIQFSINGRHDPCVVPRAVPIVEAMAALVVLDLLMEVQ